MDIGPGIHAKIIFPSEKRKGIMATWRLLKVSISVAGDDMCPCGHGLRAKSTLVH